MQEGPIAPSTGDKRNYTVQQLYVWQDMSKPLTALLKMVTCQQGKYYFYWKKEQNN